MKTVYSGEIRCKRLDNRVLVGVRHQDGRYDVWTWRTMGQCWERRKTPKHAENLAAKYPHVVSVGNPVPTASPSPPLVAVNTQLSAHGHLRALIEALWHRTDDEIRAAVERLEPPERERLAGIWAAIVP